MGDEQFIRGELVEVAQCGHGLTAAIHERRWEQQMQILTGEVDLRVLAMELAFRTQRGVTVARKSVKEPDAGIVTGVFVFVPRVTEADDRFHS